MGGGRREDTEDKHTHVHNRPAGASARPLSRHGISFRESEASQRYPELSRKGLTGGGPSDAEITPVAGKSSIQRLGAVTLNHSATVALIFSRGVWGGAVSSTGGLGNSSATSSGKQYAK